MIGTGSSELTGNLRWAVAQCPRCGQLQLHDGIRAKKVVGCVRCGSKVSTGVWLVMREYATPGEARLNLQNFKDGTIPTPRGATIIPQPKPRASVPKKRRILQLLRELRAEGGTWS